MTLNTLRLEVPDILEEDSDAMSNLAAGLLESRRLPLQEGLQKALGTLFRLNRCALTLLERQRALQSLTEEYRHYSQLIRQDKLLPALFVHFCTELAAGFKRLLLQILHGHKPSRPHMAWCLYMAQHFLAQALLRHYQQYQQPPGSLWRDSHLLYWIGEHQDCLDEPVAAAFDPTPAGTLRGLYQQTLLLALSNPFHLTEGEAPQLFSALASLAALARLQAWDEEEQESYLVDLGSDQPCISHEQAGDAPAEQLRRLELGALLIALHDPAPLRKLDQSLLLERVRHHWLGHQERRHERSEQSGSCRLVVGLATIQQHLLTADTLNCCPATLLDTSPGGARINCPGNRAGQFPVGQLLLILNDNGTPTLAIVRWRHLNSDGLHLGLRYLKGLPRPVWLRRAPDAQRHPGVLQSTPEPGNGWYHGLWLQQGHFVEGENLWLQLASFDNQTILPLPSANLSTPQVSRHPLRLA
ncbi:PilZ domain-containing protein [Pseudomonas sp. ZM23]|uniref:PilZ domain-containing protein n=1 Tax=Pseudomonas triclosanedens TaxID=2961893 RepID=A0ABY7A2Z2_9PSED|nr:PilZ domain-containing protein [Pseudomonas triclosanedens]MCP8464247.1 PilZ domain-containing protein [Pseudomonas triclosanedens]MCP8471381.1 PilZ domain-containing protein [Pseudomonas triclosanedens]MCP8477810.1 PilZ domain-containing protein [Pseudomonas triclosanedens]WAI51260.1 PilZ domain-containing protein [Pseudomonas triclosanedens]